MRELKFRLREGNKIVGYERWNSLEGKWCYGTRSDGVFDIRNPFIPHTYKDEFTGLLDKNGAEIYEGDIVVQWNDLCGSDYHNDLYHKNLVVKWEREMARFVNCLEGYAAGGTLCLEVIGNVWESPEKANALPS
uniref:Putative YopX protein n=1 Tax=viral metagenome TaxID=1070528 RepID=A0A6H2A4S3_9ZZZZ